MSQSEQTQQPCTVNPSLTLPPWRVFYDRRNSIIETADCVMQRAKYGLNVLCECTVQHGADVTTVTSPPCVIIAHVDGSCFNFRAAKH